MKSGNLNFLEPSGPLQACNGTALPLLLYTLANNHIPSKVIILALFETKDVDIVIISIDTTRITNIAINSNNKWFLVSFWEEFLICVMYRFRQTLIY
jgi:hypothetical protein